MRCELSCLEPCRLIINIAGMVDRRKQQNYKALPSYFTDSQWGIFESSSREKSTGVLLNHAWQLGMRCPSECTFGVIQNFLELVRDVPGTRSQTSFERYERLGSLKKDWKKLKAAMKGAEYTIYLEQLPVDPRDLEPEYWAACFSHDVPVPSSPPHVFGTFCCSPAGKNSLLWIVYNLYCFIFTANGSSCEDCPQTICCWQLGQPVSVGAERCQPLPTMRRSSRR